ncbi:YcnI family protein [Leucobacter sp. cx-42]|uniref:YcnI family copper-binding membrane protein n=1 Tax=unclassified Leucobacter TaxID=2621730 RepID=UPI00165E742D|nr:MULTISPECIES: YcnI family protein [unclassified Leucobacter]MBC9954476.1 YcnI family protein [Leucobacter sp. cx-42]
MNLTTSSRRPFMLTGAAALGAIALALGGATAASAHVGATTDTNEAGSYTVVSVSVPHGCDVSPTTKVALKIPAGINAVTPTRNAFYTVEKVMEALDTPLTDSHGNEVTERVAEVVYTATTPLPADQRDVFELSLQLPEDAAGEVLYFPTVQTCAEGESAWVQIPADGQDPHELELPAPSFEVVAASADGHSGHASGSAAADNADEAASGSQTPLVITSLIVGAAGLVAGVIALIRGRKQA